MFSIYQMIHSILSSLGVIINIFLLFLALTKSPKIMRPCSALITNKALTDIMSSLANIFVMQQFVVLENGEIGIVPNGPCQRFGNRVCYAGHMLMMSFLEHNMIWLIVCYLFRYYILYVRDPRIKSICLTALLIYTPSIIHIACWLHFYHPLTVNVPLKGPIIFWSSMVIFFQLSITCFMVLLAYFWIRNILLNFLLKMGVQISSESKILNQQLVKILTFQVCIPFWIALGLIIGLLQYTELPNSHILGYCITSFFMLAPVISPFSYIIFVPHYWNFCVGKKKVALTLGSSATNTVSN